MNTLPTLTTQRLTLRQLSKNDAGAILQLRSNPEINKYLDRKPCKTLEDALGFIGSIIENQVYYWAITVNNKNELIGTICLFGILDGKCEIGYELLTEWQGKGIMLEAAKQVIAYANDLLSVKTIDAITHKQNLSSSQLLQKLGFQLIQDNVDGNANLELFRLGI